MELLLDTHTFIWALTDDKRLPKNIKDLISDENNIIFISAASLWEIEIKHIKNPSVMPYNSEELFSYINYSGYDLLPMNFEYTFFLNDVLSQGIHNDPFDHFLLASALKEKMTLITHDSNIAKYKGVKIISY